MSISSAASTACKFRPAGVAFGGTPLRSHSWPGRVLYAGWLALFCCASAYANPANNPPADSCSAKSVSAVDIRHVHDGDTVIRADGESIRLIGLDTPELARDGRPAEPGARVARDRLRHLLASGRQVSIQYGRERRDHYDRLLGHLYVDQRNVQAELLRAGLATPLYFAPNLDHADCYTAAAQQARRARVGLWALPDFQPQAATALHSEGYRVVNGRVQRVGRSRCCIWLNLDDDVAVRIKHHDSARFAVADWDNLVGHTLQVRGTVYRRNEQWRMTLRHPQEWTLYTTDPEPD